MSELGDKATETIQTKGQRRLKLNRAPVTCGKNKVSKKKKKVGEDVHLKKIMVKIVPTLIKTTNPQIQEVQKPKIE